MHARSAGRLRRTLISLQSQTDSDFRILVVDNGSGSSSAVVEELDLPHCDYIIEPIPGLSRARNRALSTIGTELVAWIDDDEVADAEWVRRLKEGFLHQARPAAVCGVMLPAELESEAQVRFEQYGGFNKGRGILPEVLRMGTPSVLSPLYPLPAVGSGGNMAFRTKALRSVKGFDPCLGAGTRTHGGEETGLSPFCSCRVKLFSTGQLQSRGIPIGGKCRRLDNNFTVIVRVYRHFMQAWSVRSRQELSTFSG